MNDQISKAINEVQIANNAAKEVEQISQNTEAQLTQFKIEHMRLKEKFDKIVESEQNYKDLNEKYRSNFMM